MSAATNDFDPTPNPANPASDAASGATSGATSGAANPDTPGADATPADDRPHRELPLPDQAWRLHCQGKPFTAIARALQLDRHTVARYVKQIHEETQADRRADRSLVLTQTLGALAQVQAAAWDLIEQEQTQQRLIWDRYLRAADAAAAADNGPGGYTVKPPTSRPQTARLLTLILTALRQVARLELLDDPAAPARAGDTPPADQPKDSYLYIMTRRSDQEELDQQDHAFRAAEAARTGQPIPEAQPYQPHDFDGNPPMEHAHPQPDLRPDGTDDWFVYQRIQSSGGVAPASAPSAPSVATPPPPRPRYRRPDRLDPNRPPWLKQS